MRPLISYDHYTELLSKNIHRTIKPAEVDDLNLFEAVQPKACPQCQIPVWSPFIPSRVVHDVGKCPLKPAVDVRPTTAKS